MADAKARAEARRKAILARGGDRLARITTSARGEDGAAYMHDRPSPSLLPLLMPPLTPPRSRPATRPRRSDRLCR